MREINMTEVYTQEQSELAINLLRDIKVNGGFMTTIKINSLFTGDVKAVLSQLVANDWLVKRLDGYSLTEAAKKWV